LILTPVFFVVIERVVERRQAPEEPTPMEPAPPREAVHA
jgi:hypothetical protein